MPDLSAQFTIGTLRVAALSDGVFERDLGNYCHGIAPDMWTAAAGIANASMHHPVNFGSFLVRDGQRTLLIDSGIGPDGFDGMPAAPEGLLHRLRELNVAPEELDVLLHTHLHSDHVGWNVTGEEHRETFPNATIMVAQREIDYWFHPAVAGAGRGEVSRRSVEAARLANRLETFEGQREVSPGVTAIPTPGHTPGHVSFLLASQGEHLLILGDVAHHPMHLEHHDWVHWVDVDPSESTRSRLKICELAIDRDALVTAGHFLIPTLGRIRRDGHGYRFDQIQ